MKSPSKLPTVQRLSPSEILLRIACGLLLFWLAVAAVGFYLYYHIIAECSA